MSAGAKLHVVLCEGFDDRSFWRGWLLHLGCSDPTDRGRKEVLDAWGRPVKGQGRFLLRTPGGSDVIVQPFHGRNNARTAVAEYIGGRQAYRPDRVVVNLDSDAEDDTAAGAEDHIREIARGLGADIRGGWPFEIGGSLLHAVVWRCEDARGVQGIPQKQTLERLLSAAIRAAYPDRGPAVEAWLSAKPYGLRLPKSYAFSYYAKWYAAHGASDFYECGWRDEGVAAELVRHLAATGANEVVERLAND